MTAKFLTAIVLCLMMQGCSPAFASPDITLKAIPIRGYVEPKNVKVSFNQTDVVVKMRAIKAFKESLAGFREYCFQIGVN